MADKQTITVFFGGRSAEHDVSLVSAKFIIDSLNREKYEIIPVAIDRNGIWRFKDLYQILNSKTIKISEDDPQVSITPGKRHLRILSEKNPITIVPDVAFPVLHGPYGEDGSIQGLFRQMNLPYVGADVLGSAVGMDKDVMKRLLRDAKIPIGKFITIRGGETPDEEQIVKMLGLPLYVKPANMGSSIGVSRVEDKSSLKQAINLAIQFDKKIVIEENITGREIECSLMGNESPLSSVPGEIVPDSKFYSYESKYASTSASKLIIPAELSDSIKEKIMNLAVETYKTLSCSGLARVDVFLTDDGNVFINEINTLPGFTEISMYPKLWNAGGMRIEDLLDKLIAYALERYKKESELKKSI